MTVDTKQDFQVYLAALHVASCGLHLTGVISMRLAHGVATLPMIADGEESTVFWFQFSNPSVKLCATIPGCDKINLQKLIGDRFTGACVCQFIWWTRTQWCGINNS